MRKGIISLMLGMFMVSFASAIGSPITGAAVGAPQGSGVMVVVFLVGVLAVAYVFVLRRKKQAVSGEQLSEEI
jgi:hypothetical protein